MHSNVTIKMSVGLTLVGPPCICFILPRTKTKPMSEFGYSVCRYDSSKLGMHIFTCISLRVLLYTGDALLRTALCCSSHVYHP